MANRIIKTGDEVLNRSFNDNTESLKIEGTINIDTFLNPIVIDSILDPIDVNANPSLTTVDLALESGGNLQILANKDFATQTTLSLINNKLVSGTDIGDVTINNGTGINAVNIQDGGNSITIDGTITANAGINLNTSLLALESGGNLATISTNLTSLINTNIHTGTKELRTFSPGHICTQNSTIVPLGINGVFTGEWQDTLDYSEVIVSINTDKNSITDGLVIQWSSDGINVHEDDVFTILANVGKTFSFPPNRRYVRIKYTNDGVAQTYINLETILKRFATKGSSHRLKDALNEQDDAIVTKTLIAGQSSAGGGAIVNVKVNPSGALTTEATVSNGTGINAVNIQDGGNSITIDGTVTANISNINGISTSDNQTNGTQKTKIVDTLGNVLELSDRVQTPTNKVINVQIGPGDIISSIPIVMQYDHHQIHEGETWRFTTYVSSLASGNSKDIRFVVPNVTIPIGVNPVVLMPHFRFEVIASDLANIYFYESTTFTVNGTLKSGVNLERNGTYTPKLTIYEDPTVNALGTEIFQGILLSTKTSVGAVDSPANEFVLKNNTQYLLRVTSGAAGNRILIRAIWYEDLGV